MRGIAFRVAFALLFRHPLRNPSNRQVLSVGIEDNDRIGEVARLAIDYDVFYADLIVGVSLGRVGKGRFRLPNQCIFGKAVKWGEDHHGNRLSLAID